MQLKNKRYHRIRNITNSDGFTLIEVMVALSVMALAITGTSKLVQIAYQHIDISRQYQQASYFADGHLNGLLNQKGLGPGTRSGIYQANQSYPWKLRLVELEPDAFAPLSNRLSDKVVSLRADLEVLIDGGKRRLKFHTLILSAPTELNTEQQIQ